MPLLSAHGPSPERLRGPSTVQRRHCLPSIQARRGCLNAGGQSSSGSGFGLSQRKGKTSPAGDPSRTVLRFVREHPRDCDNDEAAVTPAATLSDGATAELGVAVAVTDVALGTRPMTWTTMRPLRRTPFFPVAVWTALARLASATGLRSAD